MPSGFDNDTAFFLKADTRGVSPVVNQMTDGKVLIGRTTADVNGSNITAANLAAGSGISITNGAGSISVALPAQVNHSVLVGTGTGTINSSPSLVGETGFVFVGNSGADPGWSTTLAGSFTLSKAASGADVSFNVINTSNTASSTAVIQAQVAGSTASDAYYVATIDGGNDWSWGLDNSDSDSFVLSSSVGLGTNNVMRVSTAGEINYPLQPAFSAYQPSTEANETGDGTLFRLGDTDVSVALTEIFDQSGDFNPGTSTGATFTAPVTGKYQFNAVVLLEGVASTNTATLTIITSNTTYRYGNFGTAVTGNMPLTLSILADLDAADTCVVAIDAGNGAKTVDVYGGADYRTGFSGYLVA